MEEKRKRALLLLLPSEGEGVQQGVWGRLVSGGFSEKQQILLKSRNILDPYSSPTLLVKASQASGLFTSTIVLLVAAT